MPVINFCENLIGYIGNKAFTAFKSVDILNLVRNLSCCKASGIHADGDIVNLGDVFLPHKNIQSCEVTISYRAYLDSIVFMISCNALAIITGAFLSLTFLRDSTTIRYNLKSISCCSSYFFPTDE